MTEAPRRPTTFRLNDPAVVLGAKGEEVSAARGVVVTPEPDVFEQPEPAAAPVKPRRRGLTLGGVFWSALGGLLSLAVGLWATRVVEDTFARADWLGWLALGLAGLAALAGLGVVIREIAGLMRLGKIETLRASADEAHATDDDRKARKVAAEVVALYAERPETARARAAVATHDGEIVDGSDRLKIVEREMLAELDREATRAIATAAKRVSVVTAVSPRAIVDLGFVLVESMRLIRRIGTIYGGRPGTLGFLKLAKHVGAHLAVTGGMGVGDGLLEQVLGHGLAAKLSARLGEGVLNGLLTARVGLAAMAVCRPLPFVARRAPTVREVAGNLFEGQPRA
ncbi:YcjF family protein [Chenggangzhangella methanolivorans]|uniref:TIGR01620 family protein n=1 Tax=Chenggangzhangella methanolivorans TaxID=1437009 RepID=A0A9E6UMT2_9HYPH|nr:TIGR01620 family protein [Chenggangzhangella methanolivorans]QZN99493.1 TIGR01620 family protein [Chenggangzhangella methanolivorans]